MRLAGFDSQQWESGATIPFEHFANWAAGEISYIELLALLEAERIPAP